MTISQSRFGGNAEVGRNSDWKDRSKHNNNPGLYAGLGVMAAGGGTLGAARVARRDADFHRTQQAYKTKSFRTANDNRRKAKLNANAARTNEQAFSIWNSHGKPTRVVPLAGVNGGKPGSLRPKDWDSRVSRGTVGQKIATERILAEQTHSYGHQVAVGHLKEVGEHRQSARNFASRGKKLSRIGRTGLAGGALIAGGSLFANEAKRGTIGAKRSNKMVAGAPSPAMERSKRLNGM